MADQNPHVKVQPNGPYLISGPVPLRTKQAVMSEHGEPFTWQTGDVTDDDVAYGLCRCGGGVANKPYCDETHATNGFDGTERASTDMYG